VEMQTLLQEITVIVVVRVAEEVGTLQRQAEQEPQDKVMQVELDKTLDQKLEGEGEEPGVLVIQDRQQSRWCWICKFYYRHFYLLRGWRWGRCWNRSTNY